MVLEQAQHGDVFARALVAVIGFQPPAQHPKALRQLLHYAQLFGQQSFLDLTMAAQPALEVLAARLLQPGVEFVQTAHLRHRYQEVCPAVTHHRRDGGLAVRTLPASPP